jgi:GNAT superfamily N-acetyltransferase
MGEWTIRLGQPEDALGISDLLRAMYTDVAQLGGAAVRTDDAAWAEVPPGIAVHLRQSPPPYRVFLAAAEPPDGRPVGLVVAHAVTQPRICRVTMRLQISAVYVTPSHRRRGIAQQLLDVALRWGDQVGCAEAVLEVVPRNGAQALYRRLGFMVSDLTMTRPLPRRTAEVPGAFARPTVPV